MHTKKLMTLLLAVVMVLSLAACGAKGGDHMDGMDNEPKTPRRRPPCTRS